MHDINPLGPMFHLKELERQAAPRLRPVSPPSVGALLLRGWPGLITIIPPNTARKLS